MYNYHCLAPLESLKESLKDSFRESWKESLKKSLENNWENMYAPSKDVVWKNKGLRERAIETRHQFAKERAKKELRKS